MKKYIIETIGEIKIAVFQTEEDRWQWTKKNCEKRYIHGQHDWGWFTKDTNEQILYYETR